MTGPLRIALVGLGKIARDEHVPAIARTRGAQLVAVASRNAALDGVACHADMATMLAAHGDGVDTVILCQPPQVRFAAARDALLAGKHVFLEKPPGATLSEVAALVDLARAGNLTLFASWHSRWSPPVVALKSWCAARPITRVTINWKEDVRRWHPGQDWIWQAGGFGVFDPGINALSILTEILPDPVRLCDARLEIPANRAAPIGVDMMMQTTRGAPVTACFDWRQTGAQTWEIIVESHDERYHFTQGGDDAATATHGADSALAPEYRAMYSHFVNLVRDGRSDVDIGPLQLVADACMRGIVARVAPFED
ncbi:MAG: Gfo/Idh/MocA family protein [Sphingopyxis sp.]